MVKKKNLLCLLAIMMATMVSFSLTSCGGDDGGNGNGVNGYYISDGLYTNTDFMNDRRWSWLKLVEEWGDYIEPFDTDGYFSLDDVPSIFRVDDKFIYSYSGIGLYQIGASGTRGKELLYQFDAGEYGTLGFYGYPDANYYYTRDGDKLIMDVGDGIHTNTFVITSSGLNLSGGGSYTKYNPNTVY